MTVFDAARAAAIELGRQVDNCDRHQDRWCSCKVEQFISFLLAARSSTTCETCGGSGAEDTCEDCNGEGTVPGGPLLLDLVAEQVKGWRIYSGGFPHEYKKSTCDAQGCVPVYVERTQRGA